MLHTTSVLAWLFPTVGMSVCGGKSTGDPYWPAAACCTHKSDPCEKDVWSACASYVCSRLGGRTTSTTSQVLVVIVMCVVAVHPVWGMIDFDIWRCGICTEEAKCELLAWKYSVCNSRFQLVLLLDWITRQRWCCCWVVYMYMYPDEPIHPPEEPSADEPQTGAVVKIYSAASSSCVWLAATNGYCCIHVHRLE